LHHMFTAEQMEAHAAMCHFLWDHGSASTRASLSTLGLHSVDDSIRARLSSAIDALTGSRSYKALTKHRLLLAALRMDLSL